ncbi:MAG: RusA family crossover junction endodeoxyribonuclease [Deltaproteobacteria bacterium]|nr:RusA family crossover junction endodeoxyribonuclease [Deltaproteobacteria bacterium]
MKVEITLPGRPMSKKNHQQIWRNRKTGKPFVVQSEQYQNYETECLWHLKKYRGPCFTGPVRLKCEYWMPTRQKPDLVGLIQATQDILQKAGIIRDDQDVMRLDGSKIVGVDRENPRVEIEIIKIEGLRENAKHKTANHRRNL